MESTQEEILEELNSVYNKLLQEPNIDISQAIREITRNIPTTLNLDHNKMLLKEVSMQEVEEAVMTMPLGKSPWLDGFTIDLFNTFWSFIKEDVHAIVENSRRNKTVMGDFNATFLTLIPKDEGAYSTNWFRPTYLFNSICKII